MTAETVACPHCSEQILKTAKVCRYCHRDIVKKSNRTALGCLVFLVLMGACWAIMPDAYRGGGANRPAAGTRPPPASTSQTITLKDGSQLTIQNLRSVQDWACGARKMGRLATPAGSADVMLYFDRTGKLLSVNNPADNSRIYDATEGRECLMNWKTNQMELLTDAEYRRFEKEAGK